MVGTCRKYETVTYKTEKVNTKNSVNFFFTKKPNVNSYSASSVFEKRIGIRVNSKFRDELRKEDRYK